jgi:hypothetical protein
MAPPFRVWFVSETGDDTTGDGTADSPFRTLGKAVTDAGTVSSLHVNPAKIMVGEGDFTETSPVQLTRTFDIEGMGTYLGGVGGTRIILTLEFQT